MVPLLAFGAVVALMYVELRISQRHERLLRRSGAYEPPGDVYRWMRIVYPACFLAMAAEGVIAAGLKTGGPMLMAVFGGPTPASTRVMAGVVILAAAKSLKFWAIASLGPNWSFRVLVRPGTRLVTSGPYRYLRHPNYVAIVGELLGMALTVRAPITGGLSLAAFSYLLYKRIAVEERALGLRARMD